MIAYLLFSVAFGLISFTPSINARSDTSRAPTDIVNTTVGQVLGTQSKTRPGVSIYLGIPYAKPPVGELRWTAPVRIARSNTTINATAFGPDCPANPMAIADQAATLGKAAGNTLMAVSQTGDTFSEDCLTLNVWTKPQTGEKKKAVLLWVYGGGFATGNTNNSIYDGSILADENDVVIVTINYRVNIFGFPLAPGITKNLGLLDQRLAVEWTRDNIQKFGGDPARITLFGQSAGGSSVDMYSYAWASDPIVHALIAQSGTVGMSIPTSADSWNSMAKSLKCPVPTAGATSPSPATTECMKSKKMEEILQTLKSMSGRGPGSPFSPVPDNVVVFDDYPARGASGKFAKLPYMVGNTDTEARLFGMALKSILQGESVMLKLATLLGFTCPAATAAKVRAAAGVPTWRYRFYGDFPNVEIPDVGGTYHTAELFLLFGTSQQTSQVDDTDEEKAFSKQMRAAWAAFAKDPKNGPSKELGWVQFNPATDATKPSLVRLGFNNSASVSLVPNSDTDALCDFAQCAVTQVSGGGLLTGASALLNLQAQINAFKNQTVEKPAAALRPFKPCQSTFPTGPIKF